MFFRLGWLAAVRNMQRSALAVISVGLATVVLVSAVIMAQGQPGGAQLETRMALGGDIVVLPEVLGLPGTSPPSAEGCWEMVRRSPDSPGLSAYFFPELVRGGIMGQAGAPGDLSGRISEVEGVLHVSPYRAIPAQLAINDRLWWVQIRSRDPFTDEHYGLASAVVGGRVLGPEDAGRQVCMVENHTVGGGGPEAGAYGYDRWNGIRAVLPQGTPSLRSDAAVSAGDELRLVLPAGDGAAGEVEVSLQVVGTLEFPAGGVSWLMNVLTPSGMRSESRFGADDDPPPPGRYIEETLHFSLPEIWVSQETFADLAARSGGGSPGVITEYLVIVSDFSRVNAVADRIRAAVPGTVLTAVEMASLSDHLPMAMTAVPPEDILGGYRDPMAPDTILLSSPGWFGSALVGAAVVLAGLLYLGNLYVLTITRSGQLATLKALGSHNWQLLISAGTEVLVISGLGTLGGYLLSCPMLIHLWASNAAGPGEIAVNLLRGLGLVGALVFCVSLAAAAAPFLRVVRLSPGEVMRNG